MKFVWHIKLNWQTGMNLIYRIKSGVQFAAILPLK